MGKQRTPPEEMAFFLKAKKQKQNTKPHNCLASPAPLVWAQAGLMGGHTPLLEGCVRVSVRERVGWCVNIYKYVYMVYIICV